MNIIYILNSLDVTLNSFLNDVGILAPIFSTILIYLESIFAFLPLVVFITINTMSLGPVFGVLLSWIFTSLGSFTVGFLVRKGFSKLFDKNLRRKKKIRNFMKMVENLSFKNLVLIIAIPFMPSFLINVCVGLSRIDLKKYIYALFVGKLFVVSFWAYVGTNLVYNLTNPIGLIKIVLLVGFTYLLTNVVSKKLNIDKKV